MNIQKIFSVHVTTNEYGKHGECLGYFEEEAAATEASKNKGWYGGDASVSEVNVVEIEGKLYILEDTKPIELHATEHAKLIMKRRKARAKLSDDEREALGL